MVDTESVRRREMLRIGATAGVGCLAGCSGVKNALRNQQVQFSQSFENTAPGSYPDSWEKDGAEQQRVVARSAHQGQRSLKVDGTSERCWEAIANAPIGKLPTGKPVTISGAIRTGVEGEFDCHDNRYGSLRLRTDAGDWEAGASRTLLTFRHDGTLVGPDVELGSFTPGTWVTYEITYAYDAADTVTLKYTIDGDARGNATAGPLDAEPSLSYLSFYSGDFTGYWDSLEVAY